MWKLAQLALITAIGIGLCATPFFPFVFVYVPVMWHYVMKT